MPYGTRSLQHFGPEPHVGSGPESVHASAHKASIGKTVAAVYLGDDEPFKAVIPEDYPPDGMFHSEYLAFEFTDGSSLVLRVGSGNSFDVAPTDEAKKVLDRAKKASPSVKYPAHESEGQALTEASQKE